MTWEQLEIIAKQRAFKIHTKQNETYYGYIKYYKDIDLYTGENCNYIMCFKNKLDEIFTYLVSSLLAILIVVGLIYIYLKFLQHIN